MSEVRERYMGTPCGPGTQMYYRDILANADVCYSGNHDQGLPLERVDACEVSQPAMPRGVLRPCPLRGRVRAVGHLRDVTAGDALWSTVPLSLAMASMQQTTARVGQRVER